MFKDGEIRGHYEETPEDHPIAHFEEKVFGPRTEKFKEWLGDWAVDYRPETGKMRFQRVPAASLALPEDG